MAKLPDQCEHPIGDLENCTGTASVQVHGPDYITLLCEECSERLEYSGLKMMPISDGEDESDNINHPKHYNSHPAHCECGRRIECITITRHHMGNVANAIKYLWRCGLKEGEDELTALGKAKWYIEDEIKRLQGGKG